MENQINQYHTLIVELQNAKKHGFIKKMLFLEQDLIVILAESTPCSKLEEIAQHIEKKYKVYTKASTSGKKIIIHDVYCLDSGS